MDINEAMARAAHWRANPRTRPLSYTARIIVGTLAVRIAQLEEQLEIAKRLAASRQVLIFRGNPDRGPETGRGFGRKVPAVIVDAAPGANQVQCRLLVDDPGAVGAPCRAGDVGLWSVSQIIIEESTP